MTVSKKSSIAPRPSIPKLAAATADAITGAVKAAAAAVQAPDSAFDGTKAKKKVSMTGGHRAHQPAGLKVDADLQSAVAAHRSVVYAGGAALPQMKLGTGYDVAKAAGLDLSRYTSAQLRKLDAVGDAKIDANEAAAIVRFADADDDGKVSPKELLALDYVMGKNTEVEAMEAFVEIHRGRVEDRATNVEREAASASQVFDQKDKAHDALVDSVHRQENEVRADMNANGFTWTDETPAQIKQQMAELQRTGRGPVSMAELDARLEYAQMRETNKAELQTSYDAKEAAKKIRDDANVEARAMRGISSEATKKIDGATVEVARFRASEKIADLTEVRAAVETDPKVRDAFVKYAKAAAIQNAVRDGKLDGDDVDMDQVKADLKDANKVIRAHTAKLEKVAEATVKMLEDPKFQERVALLPEDEQVQVLTDMQALIADTEAGHDFFKRNIQPVFEGKSPKSPGVAAWMKATRHVSKLGLNMTGVWGAKLAHEVGGKKALALMDNQLARVIGVDPSKMKIVNEAVELVNAGKKDAAKELLAKDPELKKLSGQIDKVAGGIAVATAMIAAYDLVKDPNLRNSLAAAKSATEIAEVLSRAKVPASVARYARFAGRVGPPLDMIIGGYDAYGAAKRKDIGGAIGGVTQATGGLLGTAGIIAVAAGSTGIGMPLAVVGGAVAVLGSLVTTLWGDSPTEKWLKENAPEYLK